MIFLSSSIVFPLLFVDLMLTGKFTSLDEPTKVSEVAAIAVFPSDLKDEQSLKTSRES
jgi:hypothetical protein